MTSKHLKKIFSPASVAVIGASEREESVGRLSLRNLIEGGFRGRIYPVNRNYESIQQLPSFPSVAAIPEVADLAIICTPAATVPEVVKQCGQAGIRGIIIQSAGFCEVGAEGARLQDEIVRVAKAFPGTKIIGPNCVGIISPHRHLNASLASEMPPAGNVAFISQSGALCTPILEWAIQQNVGFSQFVSIGNMADVTIADLIDYFAEDPWTESIVLYVESLTEARAFLSAARAFTQSKPIIAFKSGRFDASAAAAASHTGAMVGVDSAYEAAFARAGIVRANELDDLFDSAEFLARHPKPCGDRLAIVTNAGGPGVMATDALLQRNGKLAPLSDATIAALDAQLPAAWSRCNPVDVIGDASDQRYAATLQTVLRDPNVDAALVLLAPQATTDPSGVADAVIAAAKSTTKPVLASWMGCTRVAEGIRRLTQGGIPVYATPEKCVRVFMQLVRYGRNREMLCETPLEVPLTFPVDETERRKCVVDAGNARPDERTPLSEYESKLVLKNYGFRVAETEIARSQEEAVAIADRLGYPVVLKVYSPQIMHKTDVDGVELNLTNGDRVREAYQEIGRRVAQHRSDFEFGGVTVQPMVVASLSRELILGAKRDPVFGPVLLVGAGGITAELVQDCAMELPPLNERLARRMLESLQSWPLLTGYRGRRGVNVDLLVECLLRMSKMIVECPEIAEIDINPLMASDRDVIALDSRIILDGLTRQKASSRFAHLAIRPYPEEFIRNIELRDGTPVVLRPIKPEDEPMWHRLIESCSAETIQQRFRYMFRTATHAMASRFCFIDYDRELAIVVEVVEEGVKQIAGVARFVADADHYEAEFAILVADRWQGRGLGSLMTDKCLTICKRWNIQSVVAETAASNHRMIQMFQRRGFEIDRSKSFDTVMVKKSLVDSD
ncbi:Succinyl-CoA ligase [ADP-forming] subunit alpha [Rosistilla carotiformis]|uniref:Succinyl-CoA ligase [ADP-forming] subunit alpha n=1 Tax=Rosistilla carotiformis TaxID=2528017 RepID=A0A518JYU3_9BACT|nr:bifunctional acetate--CoA ligase family protein/GNAT family N-acetyltransferase [Rosistilla carotiformis]QDV70705.1 Succinyl-CoA ligase [ADP-forming] subunit alpha [Rosistilla carotiformis]